MTLAAIYPAGCEFYGFSTGVTGITSIMTLAAIAGDRRQAICRPLELTRQLTRRRAYVTILGLWMYGLVFSVVPLLGVEGRWEGKRRFGMCCKVFSGIYWDRLLLYLFIYLLRIFVGSEQLSGSYHHSVKIHTKMFPISRYT